jgi:phosphoglycerol transferase MdoB-like AlkP superfamily enzyme
MNRINKIIVSSATGIIATLLISNLALAVTVQVTPSIPGAPQSNIDTVTGVLGIVQNAVTVMYALFFILTVVLVLWAAFLYLTAAGNEEKVKKAKTTLIYAAVAVVVALLSLGFAQIINIFVRTGQ